MTASPRINPCIARPRHAHIWARELNEHYVEPPWCSERLLAEEPFSGTIHDPCCGFGTIVEAALRAGLLASGADIVDRGYREARVEDFFATTTMHDNIVCNPPFSITPEITHQALKAATRKAAIIFPVARLNAAHWLQGLPLRRVWLLTPRPSMPPGAYITSGRKPGGGRVDYCWLVFEQGFDGRPELAWLRRDGGGE